MFSARLSDVRMRSPDTPVAASRLVWRRQGWNGLGRRPAIEVAVFERAGSDESRPMTCYCGPTTPFEFLIRVATPWVAADWRTLWGRHWFP